MRKNDNSSSKRIVWTSLIQYITGDIDGREGLGRSKREMRSCILQRHEGYDGN